jgi:hypothetical protein
MKRVFTAAEAKQGKSVPEVRWAVEMGITIAIFALIAGGLYFGAKTP